MFKTTNGWKLDGLAAFPTLIAVFTRKSMSLMVDVVPSIFDHVFSFSGLRSSCLASKSLYHYTAWWLYDGTLPRSTIACYDDFCPLRRKYNKVSIHTHDPNLPLMTHPFLPIFPLTNN